MNYLFVFYLPVVRSVPPLPVRNPAPGLLNCTICNKYKHNHRHPVHFSFSKSPSLFLCRSVFVTRKINIITIQTLFLFNSLSRRARSTTCLASNTGFSSWPSCPSKHNFWTAFSAQPSLTGQCLKFEKLQQNKRFLHQSWFSEPIEIYSMASPGNQMRWDLTPEIITQEADQLMEESKKVYDQVGSLKPEDVTFDSVLQVSGIIHV